MALRDTLVDLAPRERFEVFLSEEIRGGEDWFDVIQRELVEANLLLLLYTDREHDWDWCMYEAGLFTDLRGEANGRVVCLSSAGDAPKPLKHLQFVPADDAKSLGGFLKEIFLQTEHFGFSKPLVSRSRAMERLVEEMAQQLGSVLGRRPVEELHPGEHLFVHVRNPAELTAEKDGRIQHRIPPDSTVTSDKDTVWRLFDKEAGVWTWENLISGLGQQTDRRWLGQLAESMALIRDGSRFREVQATFTAADTGERYRPILYRANRQSDGSIVFKVLFSHYVGWHVHSFPGSLGVLLTSVIMASRFRFELLDRVDDWIRQEGEEAAARRVAQAIDDIEQEAASTGLLDKASLLQAFVDPDDRREVDRMFDEWYEVRERLFDDLNEQTWDGMREALNGLREMNRRYLSASTRNYSTAVSV